MFESNIKKTSINDAIINRLYDISVYMEKLHESGLYISSFDLENIKINNETNELIFLVNKFSPDYKNEIVEKNITDFALFFSNLFINESNTILSNVKFPLDYMKSNIDSFRYCFSENDYDYLINFLKNGDVCYYHDFMDMIKGTSGYGHSKAKVKSSSIGVMLNADDNVDNIKTNSAAFVSISYIYIMIGVLIIIMLIIYALYF